MSISRNSRQYLGVQAIRPPDLTIADRAPTGTDTAFSPGQLWLDKTNEESYQFSGTSWITLASGIGVVSTLTGDAGVATPVAGNINILGTANEIETAGATDDITVSLPTVLIAPGSIESTTTVIAGTGLVVTTGGIDVQGGDLVVQESAAAADVKIEVTNSDNTSATSRAGIEIATGGASSGDPYLRFEISGVGASTMTMGLDNSAADLFVISNSNDIGTNNALSLTAAGALLATTSVTALTSVTATLGNVTVGNGNLAFITAGNKITHASVGTVAAAGANSTGSVVLVGGTVTVSTTAVTASSLIKIWRQSVGATGAAALGQLSVGTIVAATSFVINAWSAADATALQASDVSVIGWEIIN